MFFLGEIESFNIYKIVNQITSLELTFNTVLDASKCQDTNFFSFSCLVIFTEYITINLPNKHQTRWQTPLTSNVIRNWPINFPQLLPLVPFLVLVRPPVCGVLNCVYFTPLSLVPSPNCFLRFVYFLLFFWQALRCQEGETEKPISFFL